MKRTVRKIVEKARDLPNVAADGQRDADATGLDEDTGREARWLESGAEDPAFFIKPNDEA